MSNQKKSNFKVTDPKVEKGSKKPEKSKEQQCVEEVNASLDKYKCHFGVRTMINEIGNISHVVLILANEPVQDLPANTKATKKLKKGDVD